MNQTRRATMFNSDGSSCSHTRHGLLWKWRAQVACELDKSDMSDELLGPVVDLEGGEPAPPLPFWATDLRRQSRRWKLMLEFWSFYCKTWYSAYSKWLPPVTFWQLYSASNSFSAAAQPHTLLGSLQRSTRSPTWFKGPDTCKGRGGEVEGKRRGEGKGGTGPPFANSWIRHYWLLNFIKGEFKVQEKSG